MGGGGVALWRGDSGESVQKRSATAYREDERLEAVGRKV